MRLRVMSSEFPLESTWMDSAVKWRARRAPSRTLALTQTQPCHLYCQRSNISSPIPHGTNSKRPMLPEGPTAGTGADGDRAAGLLLRLPMPARRREARRAWLPAEPERGLEKSKKVGALTFRAGGRNCLWPKNLPSTILPAGVPF